MFAKGAFHTSRAKMFTSFFHNLLDVFIIPVLSYIYKYKKYYIYY